MVLFRYLFHSIGWLTIAFLMVLALGLTATRLLIHKAEEYRSDLEQRVSQYTEAPVKIKKLRAGMRGFFPELVLKDVTVLDSLKQQALLRFDEIRVGPDILRLVTGRGLAARWVSVVGAHLTIKRRQDGGLTVVGLKATDDPPIWLFEAGRFELLQSDINWQDLKRHGAELKFSGVDISIVNDNSDHKIGVSAELPGGLGDHLTLLMDYRGDLFLPDCCTGQLFVEGKGVRLAKFFAEQAFMGYEISDGSGEFRLWSDWKSSKVQSVYGRVDLVQPALRMLDATAKKPVSLEALEGWFRWRRNAGGWRLAANKLGIKLASNSWPVGNLAIEATTADTGELDSLDAVISYLRIDDFTGLFSSTDLLSQQQKADLRDISPRGELHDLTFHYDKSLTGFHFSSLCGNFNGLQANSWGQYPGFHNFAGFICFDSTQGVLKLASEQAEFNLPSLFRQSISLESASGEIRWERQGEGWLVGTEAFKAVSPDLDTFTHFQWVSAGSNDSAFLDLQIAFQANNAERTPIYLPSAAMKTSVVRWLDKAFAAGTVDHGKLLFYGPVNEFPFDKGQGVFQCQFNVKDMTLVYHRDWPQITDLEAKVLFHNKQIVIEASSGKISKEIIDNAVVKIPNIVDGDVLSVSGKVHGGVAQTMDFLFRSPLRNRIDPLIQVAEFTGRNQISLDLEIPLEDSNRIAKVKGAAQLSNALVHLDALDLNVKGVNGLLSFTDGTVAAKHLRGTILKAPADIQLYTRKNGFHVIINSSATVKALQKQFPFAFWSRVKGAADYQVLLRIPKNFKAGALASDITVLSNLDGIEVLLPKPLTKPKSGVKGFRMDVALEKSKKTKMGFRYGEIIWANFVFSEPESKHLKLEQGWIGIGKQNQEVTGDPGLNLLVELDEINLAPWWPLYNTDFMKQQGSGSLLNSVTLETGKLSWGDQNFGSVLFRLQKEGAEWVAGIESQYANGRLKAPVLWNDDSLLTGEFDYLKIPDNKSTSSSIAGGSSIEPTKLPNLTMNIGYLDWDGTNLGNAQLRTHRHQQGLTINKFDVESNNHHLTLSGHWFREGTQDSTDIQGKLEVEDLGRFLQQLDITEEIKETKTEAEFDLKWNDSLHKIATDKLSGTVTLNLGEGRILGIEPGVGRALGILSLDTWQRRLSLDFSDLYAEGLAYDEIETVFNIENGNAYTDKLVIDAVAAKIYGSGRIGLTTKEFDQLITVVPKSTASLPIAGAIAGGPAVGAAIFVAQKLIGENVDSIASTQYSMKGPWSDPQLTRLPGRGGILDRAWTGLKDFSGLSGGQETDEENIE